MRPRGFEPLTPGSEVQCSIQLSYERSLINTIKYLKKSQVERNKYLNICQKKKIIKPFKRNSPESNDMSEY